MVDEAVMTGCGFLRYSLFINKALFMPVAIKNGWVFSKKEDLLLFVAPLLFGWALILTHQWFNLASIRLMGTDALVIVFALLAFVDAGHVFSTVFKSYLDPQVRQQKKFLLYALPVIIYIFLILVFHLFGLRTVLVLFGYYNVYHIVRQQYGWVSITARKAGEQSRLDYYFDKGSIYAFTILPVAWIHFSLAGTEKQIELPKSALAANICTGLWLAIFAVYAGRQVYKLTKGYPFNIAKQVQMLVSFISWGTVIFFRSPLLLVVTVLLHSIPYVGIIYKTSMPEGAGKKLLAILFKYRFSLLLFIGFLLAVGYAYTKTNNYVKDIQSQTILGLPREYLVCALLLFPIMHFTIDGVIWKRKHYKVQQTV
jgi:hypothetical protein